MSSITANQFPVLDQRLKNIVKHYWVIESEKSVNIDNILLPYRSSDIIVNLSKSIEYNIGNLQKTINGVHLKILRKTYCNVKQSDKIYVFGMTFYPLGLYPLLKIPLDVLNEDVVEMQDIIASHFCNQLYDICVNRENISNIIKSVEELLISFINFDLVADKKISQVVNLFESNFGLININDFSEDYGFNKRTLERTFNKYMGVTPISFLRLCRFHGSLHDVENKSCSLTDICYEFNYFDQSHFIREFKTFSGSTPREFRNKANWIKYKLILKKLNNVADPPFKVR